MLKANWRNFDFPLFLATLVLVALGEVMIYSSYEASLGAGPRPWLENTVVRQALFAVLGLALYILAAMLDYRILVNLSRWIYSFVILILLITLGIGFVSFGAQSWVGSRTLGVQPSELCKVLMIIILARRLDYERHNLEGITPLLLSAILVIPPTVLIYVQPDFGTALMLVVTWLGMVFLAGVRWRHILVLTVIAILLSPLVWLQLKGYMRERIITFLVPNYDPLGASYNTNQALISIGSGGWWGKGLLRGTQSQLYFLRVRHTDFIFSVFAEELGFVGGILLVALFLFIIMRLMRIASLARDASGRLIVGGVATTLLAQTVINLGMNVGLLPVTGLPLPLVSYGGSSLVTTLLALGLAQSVMLRHRDPELTIL